ncbi:MAG TPA: EGF domain-containing protein [Kofleriaceae bacterium]|nr:EGF domain-containing protein [Kofleriaceae bacterium]
MRSLRLTAFACGFLALALAGCPDHLNPIDCTQCSDHTSCTPGVSVTCECEDGFAGDGTAAGTGCIDVNECTAGTADCAATATCSNTEGGFDCDCPSGYAGDGTAAGTGCTDVDECSDGTAECAAAADCTNTPGGYTCACPDGYTGDGSANGTGCTDIDECATGAAMCVTADDGGTCTNTPGSYTCGCDEDNDGNGVPTAIGGTGCTEKATNPRLLVPRRMVNDKTLTVRADILDNLGKVDIAGCFDTIGQVRFTRIADNADVPITVTVFDDSIPAPEDGIRFYHGEGSVSFTLDGGAAVAPGDYRLSISVGALRASRIIHVLSAPTWRVMPATLAGDDLTWGPNENIRISQHNTEVPAGQTLTIKPGTIIMVDTTGGLTDGTLINVNGQIDAEGTLARPIHFFSERGPAAMTHAITDSLSNPNSWRGIFFFNNGTSLMQHIVLTGAGNGVVVSHPRPPILNLFGTHNLTVEDSALVDSTGMMFQSPGTGTYNIRRTLVSRVGIGAEFLSSGHTLRIEDTWWTGIGHGPTTPTRMDGDGVHVDGAGSNQLIKGCVIADIGDDCIDQSNSNFTLQDSILHACHDKVVSLTNGSITVHNSLLYDGAFGIRGTASVYNTTISAPAPIATVATLQESIVWPQSVPTCTGTVNYSIVGSAADLGCGMGNQSVNPRFVNPGQCDYTPAPGSPALNMGPMNGRVGWQGFPSWSLP